MATLGLNASLTAVSDNVKHQTDGKILLPPLTQVVELDMRRTDVMIVLTILTAAESLLVLLTAIEEVNMRRTDMVITLTTRMAATDHLPHLTTANCLLFDLKSVVKWIKLLVNILMVVVIEAGLPRALQIMFAKRSKGLQLHNMELGFAIMPAAIRLRILTLV